METSSWFIKLLGIISTEDKKTLKHLNSCVKYNDIYSKKRQVSVDMQTLHIDISKMSNEHKHTIVHARLFYILVCKI